jgi:hypothetical protein
MQSHALDEGLRALVSPSHVTGDLCPAVWPQPWRSSMCLVKHKSRGGNPRSVEDGHPVPASQRWLDSGAKAVTTMFFGIRAYRA